MPITEHPSTDPDVRNLPHPAPTSRDDAKSAQTCRTRSAHCRVKFRRSKTAGADWCKPRQIPERLRSGASRLTPRATRRGIWPARLSGHRWEFATLKWCRVAHRVRVSPFTSIGSSRDRAQRSVTVWSPLGGLEESSVNRSVIAATLILGSLFAVPAFAADWTVPGQFPTIQLAVDSRRSLVTASWWGVVTTRARWS